MKSFFKSKYKYIILFLVLFMIGFFIPYSHDDWFWGTNWGIDMLNNGFENVNGRYAGNLLVLLLTRSRIIRALIMAVTLLLIFMLIKRFTKGNDLCLCLSVILLFTLSSDVLKQTVTWTSGFVNYVVPMVGILYYIYLNSNNIQNKENNFSKYVIWIMAPLGFINCLFMENITTYNLVLALFFVLMPLIKKRKVNKENILYLIGTIAGMILMFSNNVYGQISEGTDQYGARSIGNEHFIMSLIQKTCEIILKNLVFQNIFIIILISIFSLLILKKVKNNSKIKNIISIIIYSYTSYVIVFNFISIDNLLLKYTDYFNALITLIYCISIFLVVCLYSKNKNLLLFILISILIMIIPLLVVNPIQSRCMLPPYILLIIFTLLLCKEANINLDKFSYAINIFTIFVLGFMLCIYGYAFKVDNSRINYINENSNSNYLTLPKIPNRSYVYNPNPVSNDYIPYFKEFYNIKDNTEITFVETNEWVK